MNHPSKTISILALLFFSLLAFHCGDDTEPSDGTTTDPTDGTTDPLADIDYPEYGVEVRFELDTALDSDFFAFPYPSDLRLNEAGGPDLSSFPTEPAAGSLLTDAIEATETALQGFSVVSAIYFAFGDSLDPTSLPADAEASTESTSSVYVFAIDPDSPWYGRRHPVEVHYRDEEGIYWDQYTLVMQPLFGFPFRADTTYAAVVTTSVLSEDGRPAIGTEAFRGLFAEPTSVPNEVAQAYAPFVAALDDLRIHPNTISSATVFSTDGPATDLLTLRNWMLENVDAPVVNDLLAVEDGYAFDVYEGTFTSEDFMSGESPFYRFGDGQIITGPDGEPSERTAVDLTFAVAIPSGTPPETGWPVLLYSHGTGGNYRSFTRGATANEMARRGIASIGLNQPLHGDRNPTNQNATDLIISLTISNIVVGRDMLRQGVVDNIQAVRLLRDGFVIPSETSLSGQEIHLDPDRIVFMGHSQGAQVGALFLAVEDEVSSGVLSEGGGGAAISLLQRKANNIDIAAVVATALGIDQDVETLELYHPIVGCVIQPLLEPADPIAYGRHIALEPLGAQPHDLLMTEGFQDEQTPPAGIEALASTIGITIGEPVHRWIEAMSLQGIGSTPLPATQNMPEVYGRRPTGVLIQFPNRNHFLVSNDVGAQYQVFEFINTAMAGQAYVFRAEDL